MNAESLTAEKADMFEEGNIGYYPNDAKSQEKSALAGSYLTNGILPVLAF